MTAQRIPFYTYKQYMIDTYGAPLQRVPIDLGLGCPNREPDGSGGCTFCSSDGARAAQTAKVSTVADQIDRGIEFARHRYRAEKFMAYIQAFTGTFAPASEQRQIYKDLLDQFPFDALTIGTRPDCLPPSTLTFLEALSGSIDLWVELGVQTVHDHALAAIHRGHTWAQSKQAIEDLHASGIKVAVHVILGLPGETAADFNRTAETLAPLPISGIKIHNLHVVRDTELARQFESTPFPVYDAEAYAEILIDFLRRLPPTIPIIRINTDTVPEALIAPLWNQPKGRFRATVIKTMLERGLQQGDLYCADAVEPTALQGRDRNLDPGFRPAAQDPRAKKH